MTPTVVGSSDPAPPDILFAGVSRSNWPQPAAHTLQSHTTRARPQPCRPIRVPTLTSQLMRSDFLLPAWVPVDVAIRRPKSAQRSRRPVGRQVRSQVRRVNVPSAFWWWSISGALQAYPDEAATALDDPEPTLHDGNPTASESCSDAFHGRNVRTTSRTLDTLPLKVTPL